MPEKPENQDLAPTRHWKKAFGSLLRQLREEKGWTQAGLAEKVGLSDSSVQAWEAGKHLPRPESFNKALDLYGLTEDQFERRLLKRLLEFRERDRPRLTDAEVAEHFRSRFPQAERALALLNDQFERLRLDDANS